MSATHRMKVLISAFAILLLSGLARSDAASPATDAAPAKNPGATTRLLLHAARVFDGNELRLDAAVLIAGREIVAVGAPRDLRDRADVEMELGDATILPGFIDLHTHIAFRKVPREVVLRHGITTARDVGGPLLPPSGGDGQLRLLTAGPILTIAGGYPISVFGKGYIAEPVGSPEEAKRAVQKLVEGGAVVIKIALEPGGEPGAPWSMGHHHGGAHPPWPMASREIVSAIVVEAHRLGKRVTAHLGESQGAAIALASGVDEWAHVPCAKIDESLLQDAARQKVKIVTTLDTMSHCDGIRANAMELAKLGVTFLYGAEIAHPDVPWGIDAQELQLMHHLTGLSALELFHTTTAKAGEELGMAPLGTLSPGAPADVIAVRGNPIENFKLLEYPALVISGGRTVVNEFSGQIERRASSK
jgi:imidazolonepropionase-like amidohydrolase